MMNNGKILDNYVMEDFIPIVGRLADEFTSKESSSITYERARQLMKAVIYCISHVEIREIALAASSIA